MSGTLALRLFFAFMAFTIDIKVRAESAKLPVAKTMEQEPDGCWVTEGVCAVRIGPSERMSLKWGDNTLNLDESTLLVRISKTQIRLVQGTVWVKATEPIRVESEYGSIEVNEGDFWVVRGADRITVSAIDQPISIKPRGASESIEVLPGMENWLGGVQASTGKAATGVPIAIPLKTHLARWAKLYNGPRGQFEKEAEAFHDRWLEAAQSAAEIHSQLFKRKMASVEKEDSKREEERRRYDARTKELIKLYRSRVLDP